MKKITITSLFFFFLFSVTGFSQSTANYTITVTTIWNTTDHTSIPNDPHWSPLSGATHKAPNDILEFGTTAPTSNGIKDIAETGSTTNFEIEINANSDADQYLQTGFSPRGANDSEATLNVTVNENFPYITLVSMVAPSPDWFIATNSENLRSGNNNINNGWKGTYTIDMFAYDAGTDDGTDYESGNSVSNPRQNISMVSGAPINGNKMGTITFTYNSSTLSNTDNNAISAIRVFPNPVKDNITISNLGNIELKNIEIYNVVGNLIKDSQVKQQLSSVDLNVSYLNSGVYFFKFNAISGSSKIKKIVIN